MIFLVFLFAAVLAGVTVSPKLLPRGISTRVFISGADEDATVTLISQVDNVEVQCVYEKNTKNYYADLTIWHATESATIVVNRDELTPVTFKGYAPYTLFEAKAYPEGTEFAGELDIHGDQLLVPLVSEAGAYVELIDLTGPLALEPIAVIRGDETVTESFGCSVKMSDGIVVVGDYRAKSASVFQRTGDKGEILTLSQTLKSKTNPTTSEFGRCVAIGSEYIVVSDPETMKPYARTGSLEIYRDNGEQEYKYSDSFTPKDLPMFSEFGKTCSASGIFMAGGGSNWGVGKFSGGYVSQFPWRNEIVDSVHVNDTHVVASSQWTGAMTVMELDGKYTNYLEKAVVSTIRQKSIGYTLWGSKSLLFTAGPSTDYVTTAYVFGSLYGSDQKRKVMELSVPKLHTYNEHPYVRGNENVVALTSMDGTNHILYVMKHDLSFPHTAKMHPIEAGKKSVITLHGGEDSHQVDGSKYKVTASMDRIDYRVATYDAANNQFICDIPLTAEYHNLTVVVNPPDGAVLSFSPQRLTVEYIAIPHKLDVHATSVTEQSYVVFTMVIIDSIGVAVSGIKTATLTAGGNPVMLLEIYSSGVYTTIEMKLPESFNGEIVVTLEDGSTLKDKVVVKGLVLPDWSLAVMIVLGILLAVAIAGVVVLALKARAVKKTRKITNLAESSSLDSRNVR